MMLTVHCALIAVFLVTVFAQYSLDPNQILTAKTTYCRNSYYNWPQCEDTPKGYTCRCGPGYYWNTKICIALAVDSRLEFAAPELPQNGSNQKPAFAYTLLLNKPFPELKDFTMSLYIRPSLKSSNRRQCIFSYQYLLEETRYIFSLFIGKRLELTIHNVTVKMNIAKRGFGRGWSHLVITWSSDTGKTDVYFNRTKVMLKNGSSPILGTGRSIKSNGHMVLGQYSPDEGDNYDLSLAYVGSLAHVNIWKEKFSTEQLKILHSDCTFTHCGDGVEWVDLREGTRGISRLRWPSGIDEGGRCFTHSEALTTCDQYCSYDIGVQCKEEFQESILWARTPAVRENGSDGNVLQVPCPGYSQADNATDIPLANRSCTSSSEKVGIWKEPHMDDCLTKFFRDFSSMVKSYALANSFDKKYVLTLLTSLKNHTQSWTCNNPADLSSVIHALSSILYSQRTRIEMLINQKEQVQMTTFSTILGSKDMKYSDTIELANLYVIILNELMDSQHDEAWNKTLPLGQLADELLQVTEDFTHLLTSSLYYHTLSEETVEPLYRKSMDNIAFKIHVIRRAEFFGVIFPDAADVVALEIPAFPAIVSYLPDKATLSLYKSDYLCVSVLRLNTYSRLLYDKRSGKENNINTPVVSVKIYETSNNALVISNSSIVKMALYFTNTNNISNPECVTLVHGISSMNKIWDKDVTPCSVTTNDSNAVSCECVGSGFFSGTTDMYNENWWVPEPPPELMTAPSYVGCSISLFLCISTLAMLVYVGTSSRTATMHKHFAVSVIGTTAVFMIGITLTFNEVICQTFAILFHYFFLAMYAWLMNEGFNVYISITYTAHNQSTQENSGHWKYYIIGWGAPGVLVSAIVGSSFDTYFSDDMCFISWDKIWLFTGPPVAMICITLLVMTFAAKENNEVSYTKNESANTLTEYHANAVWTQLIIVTSTWAIAFLSLNFKSIVFKWVFFIFNCAQGAFMFVFFFLLNEEVRTVIKTKEIKQQLGWDVSMDPAADDASGEEENVPLNRQAEDDQTSSQPLLHRTVQQVPVTDWIEYYKQHPSKAANVELDTLTETDV